MRLAFERARVCHLWVRSYRERKAPSAAGRRSPLVKSLELRKLRKPIWSHASRLATRMRRTNSSIATPRASAALSRIRSVPRPMRPTTSCRRPSSRSPTRCLFSRRQFVVHLCLRDRASQGPLAHPHQRAPRAALRAAPIAGDAGPRDTGADREFSRALSRAPARVSRSPVAQVRRGDRRVGNRANNAV